MTDTSTSKKAYVYKTFRSKTTSSGKPYDELYSFLYPGNIDICTNTLEGLAKLVLERGAVKVMNKVPEEAGEVDLDIFKNNPEGVGPASYVDVNLPLSERELKDLGRYLIKNRLI